MGCRARTGIVERAHVSRYDLGRDGLGALLAGEPAYRVNQVFDGFYRRLAEPGELTELPGHFAGVLGWRRSWRRRFPLSQKRSPTGARR